MASTKNTFESATFLANTFANGLWRGTGVTVVAADADQFYAAKGLSGVSFAVRGLTSQSAAAKGVTNMSLGAKGDQ